MKRFDKPITIVLPETVIDAARRFSNAVATTTDYSDSNQHDKRKIADDHFISKLEECSKAGIRDLVIDPGFGFGKTIEHNFKLLKGLSSFSVLNRPVLVGLSRKSTIYKTLGSTAAEALNGTTVLNTMALLNGASILRVHDVKEAKEAIMLYNAYKKAP